MRLTVVFCLLFATTFTLDAQTGCIKGKALDTKGSPIRLDVIFRTVDQSFGGEGGISSEGDFEIDDLPAGTYLLVTSDEAKADRDQIDWSSAERVRVTEGDSCSFVTLRKAPRGRLLFHATNALTGEKIEGVDGAFRFDKSRRWRGEADRDEMQVPPSANLELQLSAHGYENSDIQQISPLHPGETREIAVVLRPVPLGCLTGTVMDQQGVPVPGVRVQPSLRHDDLHSAVEDKSTNKKGQFKFDGLQPGDYFVFTHAESVGYVEQHGEFHGITVAPGTGCATITLRLAPKAAKLRFKVVDAVTQLAIQDATVWASASHGNGKTATFWTSKALENPMLVPSFEQFQLFAGAKGYQTDAVDISPLQPEEIREITIHLQPKRKKAVN